MEDFILAVDVGMSVAMLMGMGVYQTAMPVLVGVSMGMFMGVLRADGVFHHQDSCDNHNDEAHIELDAGTLIQQQDAEDHTQEGGDGVIGAGVGGAQILLGFDVKVDTQTVSNETQQKHCSNPENAGDLFSDHQGDHETAQTGEGALNGGDLDGGLGTEHPGTVVFQTSAAGGTQNQQRADVKLEAAFALKAQRNAGSGNQNDCQRQPLG